MPPSLGVKPRKYCSKACLKGYSQKPASAPCRVCGSPIQQTASRGRLRVLCSNKCKNAASKGQSKTFVCKACKQPFTSFYKKDYCSKRCRWPRQIGDIVKCGVCGNDFATVRHKQKYCSQPCVDEATRRRNKKAGERSRDRAKRHDCLNCGRKYVARNRSRCSFKFCSRECAFEARRLKKKCAERPLEVANAIALWFLSWADDYAKTCVKCGGRVNRTPGGGLPDECGKCRAEAAAVRMCRKCGAVEVTRSRKLYCHHCRDEVLMEHKRRARKRRRKIHGSDMPRRRCRRVGAPYTPVNRRKIFDRDGWVCQLCGVELLPKYTRLADGGVDPRSPTIDHIVPLALGPNGPGHVESNVHAACWGCNTEKGASDHDSFVRQKATQLES